MPLFFSTPITVTVLQPCAHSGQGPMEPPDLRLPGQRQLEARRRQRLATADSVNSVLPLITRIKQKSQVGRLAYAEREMVIVALEELFVRNGRLQVQCARGSVK